MKITNNYQVIKLNFNRNIKYWKKENIRLHSLNKEYLLGTYEENAYNIYLIFLGHYFFEPVKYDFILTNSMKIKSFLWTSPIIVRKEEDPIIELRTIDERINDLSIIKVKFYLWKSLLRKSKRIPRLFYKSMY
jgi:hypothetical protein